MNPELLKELFHKYLNGDCTPEEITLLENTFFRYLETQDSLPSEKQIVEAAERVRQRLADNTEHRDLQKRRRTKRRYLAAAILLISISIGITTWQIGIRHKNQLSNPVAEDARPGGNKALLTLTDGRTINLNEAQPGIIVGTDITYADGTAVIDNPSPGNDTNDLGNLTLQTPKGGTYQITLPDGTEVWLNASSTLRYPQRFAKNERVVDIEGEGYFAVKKDKQRPFKVRTAKQELVVLGTAFNISAYPDETATETTLVEGAVKVASLASKTTRELQPGQQARLSVNGLTVHAVDTEEFTAWKNGYFVFNDATIYSILKKFERWYDIEIDEEIKLTDDLFTGKIPRNASLKSALKIVGNTSGISFQLTGNKLFLTTK